MKPTAAILCAMAFCVHPVAGRAQAPKDPSKEEIVCAFSTSCDKGKTRAFQRGVIVTGAPEQAEQPPGSINLYVNFAYNSADLTSDARITLDRLGQALRDQRLQGFSFMIAGHTDAKGSAEYNQKLSERRASSVRQYLIAQYGIDAAHLTAKGFGKQQLLDPGHPEDGVNRRVQVVDVTPGHNRQ
jgi:outer membrane protein OmpA-like peptidoglycan-associated protein